MPKFSLGGYGYGFSFVCRGAFTLVALSWVSELCAIKLYFLQNISGNNHTSDMFFLLRESLFLFLYFQSLLRRVCIQYKAVLTKATLAPLSCVSVTGVLSGCSFVQNISDNIHSDMASPSCVSAYGLSGNFCMKTISDNIHTDVASLSCVTSVCVLSGIFSLQNISGNSHNGIGIVLLLRVSLCVLSDSPSLRSILDSIRT